MLSGETPRFRFTLSAKPNRVARKEDAMMMIKQRCEMNRAIHIRVKFPSIIPPDPFK